LIQPLHSPNINLIVLSTVSASVLKLCSAPCDIFFLLSYSHSSLFLTPPLFSFSLSIYLSLSLFLFVCIFPSISLCVLSIHILPSILIDLLQVKVMILRIIIIMTIMMHKDDCIFNLHCKTQSPRRCYDRYFFVFHVFRRFSWKKIYRFLQLSTNVKSSSRPRERNIFYNKLNKKNLLRDIRICQTLCYDKHEQLIPGKLLYLLQ